MRDREEGGSGKSAGPEVAISRLPATSGATLVGREAELAWLDACWEAGGVASVVAWGGVGKTALVKAWLVSMRDRGWLGAERVFGWSFYSQGTDRVGSSDAFFAEALRWVRCPEPWPTSPHEKGEKLARWVRRKKTILVLDGIEPLQWGSGVQEGRLKDPALERLLSSLAWQKNGLCVVTTRVEVKELEELRGEKVRTLALHNLSTEAGAALLRARGAKGTKEELLAASVEYKGHGLALTLLGSYLDELAEGDIRRRKEIGPLIEEEKQGGHARRVMEAYRARLGAPEVAILHILGLFDRPAGADEIGALRADPLVTGLTDGLAGIDGRAWNKAVARLRKIGLLSEEGGWLDAHPLVREHFGEQLRKQQPKAWREGHRRLYEHLKTKAKELPENVEEMEPLYAAVVHGCLAGKNQEALVEVYWKRIQRRDEGFSSKKLGAFGSAAAVLSAFFAPPWDRLAPGLSEPHQPFVLNAAGFALRALGRPQEAARPMRLGMEQDIMQQDWKSAAADASNLTELLQTLGELSEALALARRCVELADRSGDAFMRMVTKTKLAAAQHAIGLQEDAVARFEEAERIQKERQPNYPRLYSLQGFLYCDLLLDLGRDAEVRARAAQALEWGQTGYSLLSIALDHLSLGRAHLLGHQRGTDGDLDQADSHLQQAVSGLRYAGAQEFILLGLLARAAFHLHKDSPKLARGDLDEALSLSTRCGMLLHEADAHLVYGRLCLAERDPSAAREHLARARQIIDRTGYHRRDGELKELTLAPEQEKEKGTQGRKDAEAQKDAEQNSLFAPLRPGDFAFSSPSASTTASPSPSPAPPPVTTRPEPVIPVPPVDFLLFAPLEEEREAVLAKLPGYHQLESDGSDVHVYYAAEIETRRADKAVYRVIVVSPTSMGPIEAVSTTTIAVAKWRPAHVIVVGIAGGLEDAVALGDVMVARSVADYTVGEVGEDDRRNERWVQFSANAALLQATNAFRTGWTDLVKAARPKREGAPARHTGIVATGGDVIASKKLIATYRKDMPKLIGVEMEGGGVATAVHNAPSHPGFLMVRGVSDLANARGNAATKKRWRAYAADVAAAYVIGLLRKGPVPALLSPPNPR